MGPIEYEYLTQRSSSHPSTTVSTASFHVVDELSLSRFIASVMLNCCRFLYRIFLSLLKLEIYWCAFWPTASSCDLSQCCCIIQYFAEANDISAMIIVRILVMSSIHRRRYVTRHAISHSAHCTLKLHSCNSLSAENTHQIQSTTEAFNFHENCWLQTCFLFASPLACWRLPTPT